MIRSSLLIPLILFAATSPAFGVNWGKFKKKLDSANEVDRHGAYNEISFFESKDRTKAIGLLRSRFDSMKNRHDRVARRASMLVEGWDQGIEDKEALLAAWEKAARDGLDAIFDKTLFPDPPGPVSAPFTGYYEVMKKVEVCRTAYAKYRAVVDSDLIGLRGCSKTEAFKLRDELILTQNRYYELGLQLDRYGDNVEYGPSPDRFVLAMLFLRCESWKMAIKLFSGTGRKLQIIKRPRTPKKVGGLAPSKRRTGGGAIDEIGARVVGGPSGDNDRVRIRSTVRNRFLTDALGAEEGTPRIDETEGRRLPMILSAPRDRKKDEEPRDRDDTYRVGRWDDDTSDQLNFVVDPGPGVQGHGKALFYFFMAGMVDDYNDRIPCKLLTPEMRRAVAINNDYRLSFGLSPYQIHPLVTRAMKDHLSTMDGMTHDGATPETRTVMMRVQRAGYMANGCGENLAQMDILRSMETWKWDGGHHRTLVIPDHYHIGPGQEACAGMDTANGEAPELPVIRLIKHQFEIDREEKARREAEIRARERGEDGIFR